MGKGIGLADAGGSGATDTIGASGPGSGGAAGTISLGTPDVRPIGISPSIGTAPGEDFFRGNQWPPENREPPGVLPPDPWQPSTVRHFTPVTALLPLGSPVTAVMPPRAWDPAYYQIVLLTEFAQNWTPDPATETTLSMQLAAALSPVRQAEERANLIALIQFREGVLSEVLSQMTTFDQYFMGTLGYRPPSHPATNLLVQGAIRCAEFVAMLYKNMFQRARPSQLWPELLPPVVIPGHAAYPSGHATQAHTIAKVLQAAATPAVIPSVVDITERLAQRIRRGREVLGLHYPSDSAAGEFLSQQIADVYLSGTIAGDLLAAAQTEWQSYTV